MYSEQIDKKWHKIWKENKIYDFVKDDSKEKYYVLEMFSYPSGAKLHIGHWWNYGVVDSFARLKKMQGYNVFHPMGFDAFGLPAENYAIKTGVHPKDSTLQNIKNIEEQFDQMGGSFDFSHKIYTCNEDYYKWTQWLFTYLYKKGLAYQKFAPVNFCPSCNTVLANEQVIQGRCERCDSLVEQKKLKQWFFKITDYAQELLDGLETLDWPQATKKVQTNWIGRSTGMDISFDIQNDKVKKLTAFTTRPETIYGVTYIAIAPEKEVVQDLLTDEYREVALEYIQKTKESTELERQFTDREKTLAFTGSYAINPMTGKKIPIIIADYVLESYANGIVMGVPAHDQRDYELAKKFDLDIVRVLDTKEGNSNLPLLEKDESYVYVNCNDTINGKHFKEGKALIESEIETLGYGKSVVKYKLKDWLVSRQRYWGAPIPVVYCDNCGTVILEEKDLPVKLPYDVEFKPDGKSPLAKCESFLKCKCPKCGADATREADTLDTFVCSSWYELRYPFYNMHNAAFDKDKIDQYVPVDVYVGGKEHAAMHLIYARFIYKALRDGGYVHSDEPFKRLIHQGLILGPDGNKMSKSKGNTIAPEEYIHQYGADALRLYLMFGFSYTEGGPWTSSGIEAIARYINRVWLLAEKIGQKVDNPDNVQEDIKDVQALQYEEHDAIKNVANSIEKFSFNTAVAKLMELTNQMVKHEAKYGVTQNLIDTFTTYTILLSPLAPHIAQEFYTEILKKEGFLYNLPYPQLDPTKLVKNTVNIAIQVNGKLRDVMEVDKDVTSDKDKVIALAKEQEKVLPHVEGKEVVKEIYVPNKLVNIVVK